MTVLCGFGMPGVMSSWGFAALHAVAREVFGDYAIISADTIGDLRHFVQKREKKHALLLSQFPEARLSELIMRMNVPFLLFLENPVDAVSYLARSSDQQDLALVRAVSASLACLEPFATAPAALVMRRNDARGMGGIDWLLQRIDQHYGIGLTRNQMTSALQHIGLAVSGEARPLAPPRLEEAAAAIIAGYMPPLGNGADLDPSLREAAEKVLLPLELGRPEMQARTVSWPAWTFFSGDRPGDYLIGETIDLTGGARCLVYGPYFHLPAGHWDVRLLFDVEQDCYGQIFSIEVHSSDLLATRRVCPQGVGSFEAVIPVEIVEPRTAIEVRVLMDGGAIEGRLSRWSADWRRAA
ncbi:hypothetical protein J2046_001713 [Rhizobium petrolearium]|uniref:hypothetical protein n=1 Tax=Neorhizobium petrolearium TaxID=515361 RepID=UPI001AE5FA19|nr:hypothetical protein [Neorhizobium petrolearium]MBP1843457.1 hypothetical protein [Neorhizobium petrolearium]